MHLNFKKTFESLRFFPMKKLSKNIQTNHKNWQKCVLVWFAILQVCKVWTLTSVISVSSQNSSNPSEKWAELVGAAEHKAKEINQFGPIFLKYTPFLFPSKPILVKSCLWKLLTLTPYYLHYNRHGSTNSLQQFPPCKLHCTVNRGSLCQCHLQITFEIFAN